MSQVVITPGNMGGAGFLNPSLLKNANLLNSTTELQSGFLVIDIADQNQNSLLQFWSKRIDLLPNQSLRSNNIQWENGFQNNGGELANDFVFNAMFSKGSYIYCYKFLSIENNLVMGLQCVENVVTGFSPPRLIHPANNSTIDNPFPLLNWQGPFPIFEGQLTYHLKLAEKQKNQNALQALNNNLPLIDRYELRSPLHKMSLTDIPLDVGKTYAWTIRAFWNGQFAGETEPWVFTYEKEKLFVNIEEESYRNLNSLPDGSYFIFSNKIYFKYKNQRNYKSLFCKIVDENTGKEIGYKIPPLPLNPGMNQIEIGTMKMKLKRDHIYQLIVDQSGEKKQSLIFKYKKD